MDQIAIKLISDQVSGLRDAIDAADRLRSEQYAESRADLAEILANQRHAKEAFEAHIVSDKDEFSGLGRKLDKLKHGRWLVRGAVGGGGAGIGALVGLIRHVLSSGK